MRHRKAGRQFGRNTSHRRAMLRALTSNLVAHERIETTDAKAKELRRVAERMITRAVRLGPVAYTPHDQLSVADRARRQAAQRQMARFVRRFAVVSAAEDEHRVDLVEKVFVDLARRFKGRPGGYTRIVKLGRRRGDNAPMSIVEFVVRGEAPKKPDAKPDKAAAAKPKASATSTKEATASAEKQERPPRKVEPKAKPAASKATSAGADKSTGSTDKSKTKKAPAKKAAASEDSPKKATKKTATKKTTTKKTSR